MVVAAVLALLVGACGTRVARNDAGAGLNAQSGAPAASVSDSSAVGDPTADAPTWSSAPPPSSSPTSSGGNVAAKSPARERPTGTINQQSSAGQARIRPNSPAKGNPSSPSDDRTAGTTRAASGRSDRPSAAPASPALPRASAPGSPAVIASVGSLSGPVGTTLGPVTKGGQLWVNYVNAKGGLNGHPVRYIVYDDGGDPARHRAQVQEAIERHRAIAFLNNAEPITGEGTVQYITDKRVPVIGGTGGEEWYYKSPMFFPQMSFGAAMYQGFAGSAAAQLVPQGFKKLGTVICVEATTCDTIEKTVAEEAPKRGFQHVYRARASITQPDYTAECLAARSAGADAIFFILDSNSAGRLAAACARQNYRPRFATGATVVADRFKDDPNLEGFAGSSTVFPYFLKGLPGADEFHAALDKHGKGLPYGVGLASGWVAGKMLEKAAAALPEPPTSEAVLRGLWTLKNDTLGGLTLPLTFVENQPATPKACWFDISIKNKAWIAPNGFRMSCR